MCLYIVFIILNPIPSTIPRIVLLVSFPPHPLPRSDQIHHQYHLTVGVDVHVHADAKRSFQIHPCRLFSFPSISVCSTGCGFFNCGSHDDRQSSRSPMIPLGRFLFRERNAINGGGCRRCLPSSPSI